MTRIPFTINVNRAFFVEVFVCFEACFVCFDDIMGKCSLFKSVESIMDVTAEERDKKIWVYWLVYKFWFQVPMVQVRLPSDKSTILCSNFRRSCSRVQVKVSSLQILIPGSSFQISIWNLERTYEKPDVELGPTQNNIKLVKKSSLIVVSVIIALIKRSMIVPNMRHTKNSLFFLILVHVTYDSTNSINNKKIPLNLSAFKWMKKIIQTKQALWTARYSMTYYKNIRLEGKKLSFASIIVQV